MDCVLIAPIICINGCDKKIVLMNKLRPDWQKGKLNMPGGKLIDYENPQLGAERELKEETNLKLKELFYVGKISPGGDCKDVYIFVGRVLDIKELKYSDEKAVIMDISLALTHPKLLNSLRYIIPKCLARLDKFR